MHIIEKLSAELVKPAVYREADQTIHLPAIMVREILTELVRGRDEITHLVDEIMDVQGRLYDAEDLLHDMGCDDCLIEDQKLDYALSV